MNLEIPGLLSLYLPWWMMLLLVLVIVPLVQKIKSRVSKEPPYTETDPLLTGAKDSDDVSYNDIDEIPKLTKKAEGNVVVVVDVNGTILDAARSVPSFARKSATFGRDLGAALEKVSTLPEVKVVVVRLSTPGGTVTGSAHLADGLDKCRAAGKKVVAYTPDLCASGGVWTMVSADYIITNKHALIGSIGVRGPQILSYENVTSVGSILKGVTAEKITARTTFAGKGKNFGDPFTPLDDEELAHYNSLMLESYELFLERVTIGRPQMTRDVLVSMGARIYHAKEACLKGLVDAVGDLSDVKDYVAKSIGVTWGECSLIHLEAPKPRGVGMLFVQNLLGVMQTYSGVKSPQVADILAAQPIQVMYIPPAAHLQ